MWVISDQAVVFVITWGGSSGLKKERGPCPGQVPGALVCVCSLSGVPPWRWHHGARLPNGRRNASGPLYKRTEGDVGRWVMREDMWPCECGLSVFMWLLHDITIIAAVIMLKEDILFISQSNQTGMRSWNFCSAHWWMASVTNAPGPAGFWHRDPVCSSATATVVLLT